MVWPVSSTAIPSSPLPGGIMMISDYPTTKPSVRSSSTCCEPGCRDAELTRYAGRRRARR